MKTSQALNYINSCFNKKLQQQINGVLTDKYIYQLGMPSKALLSRLKNFPIEMAANTIKIKSSEDYKSHHPFDLKNIENLPQALAHPIAVFESETDPNKTLVLTELKDSNNNNFIAIIDILKTRGRQVNEINSVISLYPKDSNIRVARWFLGKRDKQIERDLLSWVDIKKALNWVSDHSADLSAVGLSIKSITNVIKDFQNPNLY
jgi:hypothetical protein